MTAPHPAADGTGLTATVRALQRHTRRRNALPAGDTAAALVLDALVFAAEAEVRWLDHVETRLHRESLRPFPRRATVDAAAADAAPTGRDGTRPETTEARR